MQVLMARGGLFATNAFLVADETTGQAVVFDAPDHTVGILVDQARRAGLQLGGLWLTHGHVDHIADHPAVTEAFPDARVLIHPLDEPKLQHPERQLLGFPFIIPPRSADAHVADGQELSIGGLRVVVIHTPGHAVGHVCYHLPEEKALIGGDLIINGAVGRTDFADGNLADLNRSIRKLMKLPPDTRLLPGHGDPSTLGHELETNRSVRKAMEEDESAVG